MIAFCLYILIGLSSFGSHCEASGSASVITVPPVSVTVLPLTTATFTCEGTGDIFSWLVESAVLTGSIAQQRQISVNTTSVNNSNFSSVLAVKALPTNDDLGIGCEVITMNPFERVIANSVLSIKGVSSVEYLEYNFISNNSLLITWSPPANRSDDIPDDSLVSYQVLVIDEEDGDIILNTNTLNTNITVPNVTECDTFNFTVTALVDQYTSVDNTVCNSGSYSVNVIEDSIHSVFIEVSSMPSLHCEKKLFVKNEYNGSILVDDEVLGFNNTKSIRLQRHKKYQLLTKVKNLRGKAKDTKKNNISTYNVQHLNVSTEGYTNGSASVECVYSKLSTVDECRVNFMHTVTGYNKSLTLTGLNNSALIILSTSGVYNVAAYDISGGSLYGPAVYYPTPIEVVKAKPTSTSSSITSESIAVPIQSTDSNTVSPTVTETPGIGTTSSTRENNTNNIVPIVAGILGGIVLVILIISTICVGITVNKRKMMKLQVLARSDIATIQQPQAETNQYQDVHELRNEVPNTTSPVLLTYNRPIYDENPYHVTRSEFLPNNHHTIPSHAMDQLRSQWDQRPSITSTATQETTVDDSISSTSLNDIHDTEYTTDPNPNDTITVAVNDNTTAAVPDNEATNNTAAAMTTVNDTAATPTCTYAVVAKRTDTAVPPIVLPTADQRVVYNKVNRDVNKRGGCITVYPPDDNSAIPPPHYDDIVAQEHGTTVSSSRVSDDAAVVHGQYEKYPPTNTGVEYGIKTPVQNQTKSIDDEFVQPSASLATLDSNFANDRKERPTIDEPPMNGEELSPIQFQETGENVSIKKSLQVDSPFEEDEIVHDHGFDHISDEMVGVKPRPVVLSSTKETGTLVTGLPSKAELTTTSHEANATTNEYQTQKDNSDSENHKVPEVVPSTHNKVNFLTCIFRYFFSLL